MSLVGSIRFIYAVVFLALTPRLSLEFLGLVPERLPLVASVLVASHCTLSIVSLLDAAHTCALRFGLEHLVFRVFFLLWHF
jgi:hypothetical protein